MLALSDCLTTWNVPNEAFRVNKVICDINEFPLPFVAQLKREGGEFILVRKIEGDMVIFSNVKGNRKEH